MDAWHAVMTKPALEGKADAELRRLGYNTFFPFERVTEKRKLRGVNRHRVVQVDKPLYPRYLFVFVPAGQSVRPINEAAAVSCIVSNRGAPLRIPESTISTLMDCCGRDGLYRKRDTVARVPFEVGVPVRFLEDAPFYGLVAHVAADLGKSVRVVMEMFGAPMEITTAPENLRRLPKGAEDQPYPCF